ncbi:phosphatase PAP2 family protein [Sciscionella marina]|uniref:phosphatase PAP2 family protein n=1 Tax=Sciscionella marina TaxID=508770 RepID=UPI0003817EC1|nr:phosphatase PAP2 family protein [Sciscionella marina]
MIDRRFDPPTVPVPAVASRHWGRHLILGALLVVLVFVLGVIMKIDAVGRWSLQVDQNIAEHGREPALTTAASALTAIATPEIVGIGAMVLIPLLLLLFGKRIDAARALCILGGALALAAVAKSAIAEHRPPRALWAIPADSGASYPSGHTTVAAAIVVALLVTVARPRPLRLVLSCLGVLYILGVALSRIYLADHYPLDVLGSILTALAAGFVVTGIAAHPWIRARLIRLEGTREKPRTRGEARHP